MFLNFVSIAQNRSVEIVFYEKYKELCKSIGKSPSAVAEELGINKSNVSNWKKNGYVPRGNVLGKIAEYFGVSVEYFLEVDSDTPKVAPDVQDLIEEYNSRPEMKMLFKATKGVTAEDIERAAKFLEAMRKENN